MISICIPVFNVDVTILVQALEAQCRQLRVPTEIIVLDDASSEIFKTANKPLGASNVYHELPENMGRAGIRNLFLKYAQYDYLLFLDCDGIIIHSDFLQNYQTCIEELNPEVVCGGRIYPGKFPGKYQALRWTYGVEKESKTASERTLRPHQSFMTNNFLIRKSILNTIRFEERLRQYGHEDTLFGIELKRRNISITHLENSVLNGDIESNEEFLEKTEKGIENLMQILKFQENKKDLIENVKLLSVFAFLQRFYLTGIIRMVFFLFRKPIRRRLISGKVNLKLFDFYKLGYATALK